MKLSELPAVTFASADADSIDTEIVSQVESQLGRKLARADPIRLLLRGIEAVLMQQRYLIDETGKQNLLAFATGDNLEHIGALVGVSRKQPTAAVCTMRLTLSTPRTVPTIIPAGVRFTAGDEVYFALDADLTFLAGETTLESTATCMQTGTDGNNYAAGEINIIVDPTAWLQSAVNITKSEGGSDLETDDALRERIHTAPESFSVAGPGGAYRWHAMNASPLVIDVSVRSPSPGEVEIRPLLEGGTLPDDEMIELVYEAVNARDVRPLTDHVTVLAPVSVSYDIIATYSIARSDATRAVAVQKAVASAVNEYAMWQCSELGRDIEPSELVYRMRAAGARHIDLICPAFAAVNSYSVAIPNRTAVDYLGLEDD